MRRGGLERLSCLAEATRHLAEATDYEETLREVARVALPRRGDWSIVDVAETDGTMRRVPVVHPDPEKQVLARGPDPGWPPERDGPLGIPAVMRTRVPQLTADVTRASLSGAANSGEQRQLLRGLGITSALTVPLIVGDEVLGAITFLSERAGDGTRTRISHWWRSCPPSAHGRCARCVWWRI